MNNYNNAKNLTSNRILVLIWSIFIGILSGIVVVLYRLLLGNAEKYSFYLYNILRNNIKWTPLYLLVLCILGYFIGHLVSKNSMISGSGIPQVKGIIMGYFKNNWLSTLIKKFIAGTLGILGGLSLGREGPSIQLGACVAEGLSKKYKGSRMEKKILIASGASAGLAAAFNAPLSGVVFALEEVFKYFSPLILMSTMTSAIIADFISKEIFGLSPIFNFNVSGAIPLNSYYLLIILGIILGVLGCFFNYIILKVQKFYKKLNFIPKKALPIIPLVFALVFGIFYPVVLGGGHRVIEEINLSTGATILISIFILKFLFSMISFGSGAPGGIFFPLLILGALIGGIFAAFCVNFLGYESVYYYNFVIIAMAGYFTAIVRAPITGIILITEMTGSFQHLLSLGVVCITSYIVAESLKSIPIYDSLLENQLKDKNLFFNEIEDSKKIMIDSIVHYGSKISNKKVKDIKWPKRVLLLSIKRMDNEIIPNGDTVIKEGDYLLFLTDTHNEYTAKEHILKITSS